MIRSSSFGTLGQPPAKQPFSFGGGASSSQPQQPQSATTGGFSFGGAAAQPSTSNNNNTAASSTSLFGAPKPATAGGFSFGAGATSQPQQPQQPQQQSNPAPSLGGSLFGGAASNSAQPSTSLFGQPQQQQQQQQQQQPNQFVSGGGGFSSSLFGQSQSQQPNNQLQASQASTSASPFSRHAFYQKERFNDLPDDARKLVEEMDALITSHVSIRDEVHPKLIPASSSSSSATTAELAPLGAQIHSLYSQLHDATVTLSALSATVDYQQANVRSLANGVETDRRDLAQLWEIGDAYRQNQMGGTMQAPSQGQGQQQAFGQSQGFGQSQQGQQSQQPNQQQQPQPSPTSSRPNNAQKHRQFLSSYFTRSASDFQARVAQYRRSLDAITQHLSSLSSRDKHSPRAISDTIYFQHETFMQFAGQVAALNGEVEGLKRDYRTWYAKVFRSVRDPFEAKGEGDGLDM
ncbi:hypothetical protein BDZ90DRAFT_31058 [Jaminaea rosea]|uniref:Uncharacterized protein n=1 Tax=Jaminaea rosea TaxID=1569628 RepID=A0A316V0C8_9BASI|nr:hypothetical protein BDZ90DRAFT_31058 [Jaminaea rosea]PWN31007.1 hypothetical protein BDZ90DRAFT_31058 [Jaminaea rosea]